ncbi:hypothetical protein [Pseudokineococcus lusitanus]|uniref:Concanavalin A-like lectin/glucanase superfamily protein n=1 Tax=Pseudokineococcus lusitanus TaxID=763993 RepID=A0A3N1HTY0_9ACTN|nr:hypothetical protein [Pseudokineococcus lusitanus]ROP45961.1 hypothetical protein EDC03_0577 [Pseudokineococcus lusitanus]
MPVRTPADLGARLWWRSTEGLVAEMGAVAGWADRITGAVLSQPDGLVRPQVLAASDAAAGGYPALNFLGNGMTWLSMAAASMPVLTQPYTIAAVVMVREGGRLQTLTKTLGSGGGSAGELGVAQEAAPARWRLFAGGTYNGAENRAVLGNRTAVLGRFDGAASQLISNGRRMTAGAAGTRRADGILHVGWDPATASNGNRAWNGLLWDLAFFGSFTDADVAAYDTYAQDRYAVQVADYSRPVRGAGTATTVAPWRSVPLRRAAALSRAVAASTATARPRRRQPTAAPATATSRTRQAPTRRAPAVATARALTQHRALPVRRGRGAPAATATTSARHRAARALRTAAAAAATSTGRALSRRTPRSRATTATASTARHGHTARALAAAAAAATSPARARRTTRALAAAAALLRPAAAATRVTGWPSTSTSSATSSSRSTPARTVEHLAAALATAVALVRTAVRFPPPTTTDGDLVATIGPPEPGWALAAPRPTWHLQEPETGWLLGPPSHQPGGDRWS